MHSTQFIRLSFTGEYSLQPSVSLAATAMFVGTLHDGGLDLAFPLEGSWKTVGVRIEESNKTINATVFFNPGSATQVEIKAKLEQMLSLNVDGAGFQKIGSKDKVVKALQERNEGIRPALFPSPYEAAARAIIGHQLPLRQGTAISARIAKDHGMQVNVSGRVLYAFPFPDILAELPAIQGLATRKVEQLRVLGAKADSLLATPLLRSMDRREALAHLQQLPGIGPFSAELILLRGVGDADAFPHQEKRLQRAMIAAYELDENVRIEDLEGIAENWRPYRSWAGLLLRNSISR